MICCLGYNEDTGFACDGEDNDFVKGVKIITQIYEGTILKVKTPVMICTKCGWFTVGLDQINDLMKNTRKAYKRQRKVDMVDH